MQPAPAWRDTLGDAVLSAFVILAVAMIVSLAIEYKYVWMLLAG
ncbi:MAG TPA: hypothetical protein VGI64_07900 [Streptosporangiaceae bacterium]